MPYKRNPMRAERLCALARLLHHQRCAVAETAAAQWLERSLDDSAVRRVVLPELFLTADGALRTAVDLVAGLSVDEAEVARRLARELPFLAVEKLLVRGVERGLDRQALHEALRVHAQAVRAAPDPGAAFRERLAGDPLLAPLRGELPDLVAPAALVGRAPAQVLSFLDEVALPLLCARSDVPEPGDPPGV